MSRLEPERLINEAERIIRQSFVNFEKPWYRQHREVAARNGYPPDAIFVHLEESCEKKRDDIEVTSQDVVVHAIFVSANEKDFYSFEEDGNSYFYLLEDIVNMPGNYRWLVIPEDIELHEDTISKLAENCDSQGIGLIICFINREDNELYCMPQYLEGEFLSDYNSGEKIALALSNQSKEFSKRKTEKEEKNHYQPEFDSSGDYK